MGLQDQYCVPLPLLCASAKPSDGKRESHSIVVQWEVSEAQDPLPAVRLLGPMSFTPPLLPFPLARLASSAPSCLPSRHLGAFLAWTPGPRRSWPVR